MAGMPQQEQVRRSAPYRRLFAHQAYILCRHHGYTDGPLAEVLDVPVATLAAWKKEHPPFREAIEKGRAEFDTEYVESALLRRATGFVRKTVTRKTLQREGQEYTETIETTEEVPGDVRAQVFWLCCRHPERWQPLSRRRRSAAFPEEAGSVLVVPAPEDLATWLPPRQGPGPAVGPQPSAPTVPAAPAAGPTVPAGV
jgi:hypothetical protein